MKIRSLKELDVGVANLKIEGDVTYANPPRNVKGETIKNGKARKYDFYSQFIRIEDDSDGIGVSVSTPKETTGLEEGDHVRVMGKLAEYKDRDGEVQQILNGRVLKNKEEKREATAKDNNGKDDKNLMIAREVALKGSIELIGLKVIEPKDLLFSSDKLVKYIYEGLRKEEAKAEEKTLPNKEEEPSSARHATREGKLELREGQTPLSEDEEAEVSPEDIPEDMPVADVPF